MLSSPSSPKGNWLAKSGGPIVAIATDRDFASAQGSFDSANRTVEKSVASSVEHEAGTDPFGTNAVATIVAAECFGTGLFDHVGCQKRASYPAKRPDKKWR